MDDTTYIRLLVQDGQLCPCCRHRHESGACPIYQMARARPYADDGYNAIIDEVAGNV